jgi:hypothetical protein
MNVTRRLRLFLNVILTVVVLIAAKYLVHAYKIEFLTLDALFSSVVAGAIFIVGFLLTSTLPDYKGGGATAGGDSRGARRHP